MSTDIPFGAHPPTGGAGAQPIAISGVMQASSYFGAPSGNSPTDANPFHFAGSIAGAPPSMVAQPPPPMQPPSSSMVAPATAPPSASDFFAPSNPNMNIFNPGAVGGGGATFESQMYPHQAQPTFPPGDSFDVSSATAPSPPQPSQIQTSTNPFPPTVSGVPFQSGGGSGADFFNAETHSEGAPPPPAQGFTIGGGQTTATESDTEIRQSSGFHRHSSAPVLPGASTLFGGAAPQNPNNQLDSTGTNFFTSFSSQQQPSSLQESSSQGEESFTRFREDRRQQERPYSQEPPSPHQPSQPVMAFGGSGSLSAPSTTLHQVLPDHSDQQLQLHQAASELPHQSENSGSPFRPPSNADTHAQGVPPLGPGGADYQQMTNADCADSSSSQLALNSSGLVPNQVHPGQVHPSLTEDLGMTNASHGSMAHLRTNASTDTDLTAISAAIEDATTPDEAAAGPVQWSTSGQFSSNVESSGSSSRERDSSLNLDSKSVSSLLEGSQDDFSRYSPIRLLPPAPLGSEQSQAPQTLSTLQQQPYPSSSGVTLLPAAPQTGHKLEPSDSREQLQFAVEHGHEKKASDDLQDWEIVDSVPPASEVSQLPSSVRLLPPSSFVAVSSQPVPTATVSSGGGGGTTDVGGVSQAMMQKLSLEPSSRSQDTVQSHPPPPPSQRQGSHPSDSNTGVVSAVPSLPHPVTSGEATSPVAPLSTNFTNLERPPLPPTTSTLQSRPPITSAGYHHHPSSGHSEIHLSSNLPEPKEISSLITQIPFLTPVTSTSSLFTSQPTLLTQQPPPPPPACSSGASTAAPLGLHSVSSTTTATSTASAVTLVPPLSSLQSGDHHHPHHQHLEKHQEQLPFSADSGVRGGEIVTTAAASASLSQQQFQTEGGVSLSQFQQVQAPPVSAPLQRPDGTTLSQPGAQIASMGDRNLNQPPHHTAGSQQVVHVGAESSSVSAQSNLPAHTLPVAVTNAFKASSTTATGQLLVAPSITAVPGNPQITAPQPSRPELAQPPPPSSLPHTTSAFVQVQQQQQQVLHVVGVSSQLLGRPDSNVQPPLQSPPAVIQSQPGVSSTGPPPPIPTHAHTVYPEAGAPVVAAATTTSSAATEQHHNPPPPPPSHTTTAPDSQPPPPQPSSEPQQSMDESQKRTESQPPQPSQSQVTTGAPTTATYVASSLYQEERHEQGGPPHAPPHHPHHPPDDHGYYHDSYYHDREREPYSYGGDPRDTRYRAPSAFSERGEADHHYRHGYHHPRPDDSRARYDYSHYPDHSHDAGYGRYGGPSYGYDDHYPGGGGYPPPPLHGPPTPRHGYRDEYGMPPPSRTPYYDPYDPYGYHHPHAHHHQRPYDPRYGEHYPPPPGSRGHPPYGSEYPPDPLYDPYHQPSAAYEHDPRLQQQPSESGYDSHTSYPPPHAQQTQPSSYNPHEELNPAEASAIGGQTNNFELSQFVDSPNTRLPSRSHPTQEMQHNSTAYPDPQQQQQQQYPETDQHVPYAGEQHGYHHPEHVYGQGVTDPWYDHTYPPEAYAHESHQYPGHEGSYIAQPFYGQHEHLDGGAPTEEVPPVETTPPPPPRDTPELFAHPHVRATFGFGGQLVTILPNYPASDGSSAIVEITYIKDVVGDDETRSLMEAVDASPGPFIPGDTPKSHVVRFASKEAQKCREKISEVSTDREASRKLEDEALLWNFLVLLCQQNGVVVNSDISDLLLQDSPPAAAKSVPQVGVSTTQEESLESLRQLLFAGRKKDAVDMACSRGLWGHALMLASRMDEQTRTYVVNRFTASLMNTDPLNTFYTLLLGRTPSAVKPEGLPRAGDWKPHLAMILANRMSKLENASIVNLGDSLLSQKRLHAAHLCYHLASVHFGAYGNVDSKYSLLGIDHSHLTVGSFPVPSDLHMMEVLEFAMSLSKQDFLMPHFQLFKFLHVLKLLELGFVSKALKYCEQISCSAVVKNPHCFAPVFLHLLVETSVRLHHLNSPFDLVENEFPTWLHQLQQLVSDALSTDYAPSLFSPSPAFSSVSQSYANQQQHQFTQPIIGLQANAPASTGMGGFLNVPGAAGGSRVESGASSKEGSVINMKIDVTTAHLAMEGAPGNNVANEINVQRQEAIQSQQEQQQQGGLMQQPPVQSYDPSQFQAGYDPNLASTMANQQPPSSGGQLQTQPPQFHAGTSDTGYGGGQFGALSELHTTAGQISSTTVASSNPPPPPGDYNIAQAQVQQGGQPYYGMAVPSHAQQPDQVTMMTQVPAAGHQQQQEEEPVEGNAASAGGGDTGAQMGYDSYYGLPSTSQPQVDHPTHQQPGGYSPPQPTVYDYSQWQPGTQHSPGGTVEEEQHRQQESSTRREGVESVGSGDSHVTEKKAGEENESREKDESKKGGSKSSKGDQQQRQGKAGSGWGFNLIKYILPKKKNEAHLPRDDKPSIIWDEEKKQWIDLTADEEDQSGPPPPPTDSELSKPPSSGGGGGSAMPPSVPSTTSSGPTPSSSVAGARPSGGMESTDQGPARNTYSMQRSRRGLRSKYVDVLNPGGTTTSSSGSTGGPPPPPGPPLMGAMMPGPPQPFSGNFFVPQQPQVEGNEDSSNINTESTDHHGSQPAAALASETTSDQSTAVPIIASSNDLTSASAHSATGAQIHVAQPAAPSSSQGEFPQQNDISGAQPHLNQGHSNHHPVDSHRVPAGSVAVGVQAPGNTLPQFFNPGAFAPVNTLPQALPTGTNPQEPQDDAMSSVSLISESSQEVSQYMNRQVPPTTSAGYSRLKRGIRGVKPLQYPSSQQRPHPGHAPRAEQSGPPPVGAVRNSFQPRQPWQ